MEDTCTCLLAPEDHDGTGVGPYYVACYFAEGDPRFAYWFCRPEHTYPNDPVLLDEKLPRWATACMQWLESSIDAKENGTPPPPKPMDFIAFLPDCPGEARLFTAPLSGAHAELVYNFMEILGQVWPEWQPWWKTIGRPIGPLVLDGVEWALQN